MTHICVGNLTIIGSDNGLSPGRRQTIIWNNAGILSIGPLGTNFSEILIEILTFPFKKMRLKVLSAKWRPFCLGLNVIRLLFPHTKSQLSVLFTSATVALFAEEVNPSLAKLQLRLVLYQVLGRQGTFHVQVNSAKLLLIETLSKLL